MAAHEIHLEEVSATSSSPTSTVKQAPSSFVCYRNLEFSYSASPDGVDSNLLVLLHGRGDNEQPFARLGKSLALPQTATLALKGPQIVPLLDEHEREWWAETDMLGMGKSCPVYDEARRLIDCQFSTEVTNPDPSFSIKVLCDVLQELIAQPYNWSSESIHLFGFGQGGTLAAEAGQVFYSRIGNALGSIVSVHGPLLSLPSSEKGKTPTPLLFVTQASSPSLRRQQVTALERGYGRVQAAELPGAPGQISMPRSKAEWQPIMEFWSETLRRKNAWELGKTGEMVYEVKSGKGSIPIPTVRPTKVSESLASQTEEAKSGTKAESVPAMSQGKGSKSAGLSGMRRGFLSRGL